MRTAPRGKRPNAAPPPDAWFATDEGPAVTSSAFAGTGGGRAARPAALHALSPLNLVTGGNSPRGLCAAGCPVASRHVAALRSRPRHVVFDVETTGFSPSADQILEIGAVALERADLAALVGAGGAAPAPLAAMLAPSARFHVRCRLEEGRRVHPCATRVNGLTNLDSTSAQSSAASPPPPPLSSVEDALLGFARFALGLTRMEETMTDGPPDATAGAAVLIDARRERCVLVAHNAAFDCAFLTEAALRVERRYEADAPDGGGGSSSSTSSSQPCVVALARAMRQLASAELAVCTRRLFCAMFPGVPSSLEAAYSFAFGVALPRCSRAMGDGATLGRRPRDESSAPSVEPAAHNAVDDSTATAQLLLRLVDSKRLEGAS
jgi:DNA polymerase III epsilon subunit-like protein